MSRPQYDPRRARLYELAQRYSTFEALIDEHENAARQPGLPVKAVMWHRMKARALRRRLRRVLEAAKQVAS
jgi:hypothetical protein